MASTRRLSALFAGALAVMTPAVPSRAVALEQRVEEAFATPTVRYAEPLPSFVQTLVSTPLAPLAPAVQRELANAVYDAPAGNLPVDFPTTVVDGKPVAQWATEYTQGRLERIALARSLLSLPSGGMPPYPVSTIYAPAPGTNVRVTAITGTIARNGGFSGIQIDSVFTNVLTGAGISRPTVPTQSPIVQAAVARVDNATDGKVVSDPRALVYRLEATEYGSSSPGFLASSNVTGESGGGGKVGRGLSSTGLMQPAQGFTDGDYSVFELLSLLFRGQLTGDGVSNSSQSMIYDTVGILSRRERAHEYRLTTYGVEWVAQGAKGVPKIADGKLVWDITLDWDASGTLGTIEVQPNIPLSYGLVNNILLVPLRRDKVWKYPYDTAEAAIYWAGNVRGTVLTGFGFKVDIQQFLTATNAKYGTIPYSGL